jgi:hypothetical protein
MNRESTHTRIYTETLQNLRRIHAETGEKLLDILDRLVAQEWERTRHANRQDLQVQALPRPEGTRKE